ncbi:SDR family oxidoreductase [Ruegeria atlantica]|uniref:(-)-trans-carveol dehydrogenase n=1 Tax=Ruegeria atlantica TaxID=81569 RepID=A0A0P1E354_9RHOB|nr:SDR family oxidoreductase [Ruegeria atlantica]CUH42733.1 (-)-trans-carveol dehydrogenase [Ruegeria atlantica]
MENRWNDADAAVAKSDLELRTYSSCLIGLDPELVLHGGGNTSVKSTVKDVFGKEHTAIFVKASGFDLSKMGTEGFTALELSKLLALSKLPELSDPDMVREVHRAQFEPTAANASIEAIVHAVIPYKFVDHSHADAILTISNSALPPSTWQDLFGERVGVLPYVKPGFDLAKQIAGFAENGGFDRHDALVLENHGLFTFHDDARISYQRHIEIVDQAQSFLVEQFGSPAPGAARQEDPVTIARLRKAVGAIAGFPVVSRPACSVTPDFAPTLAELSRSGTVTPEHVVHNKPFPALIVDDVQSGIDGFVDDYQAYFDRANDPELVRLPCNPHWTVTDTGAIRSFGPNLKRANISADVARTTAKALIYAYKTGGWQGLSETDLRGLEYWELEQAKLKKAPKGPELTGRIALVSGAAAGIGRAIAEHLHSKGAVVVGLDINKAVQDRLQGDGLQGWVVDATSREQVENAISRIVQEFGGLDVVVSNAGIFTAGANVEDMPDDNWARSMQVNLDAHMILARAAIPVLRHGFDPTFLFMASRNVPAPGAGAAAYSVAKAGLTQLMRVLALELAPEGITVNVLHPDAVFDTELWTEEALQRSAARYGLSVKDYKRRNLMKAEITSMDVAEAALALVSRAFRRTTGAQIPLDGGNDRVV